MANAYVLEMNSAYFPGEGGLSSFYADTNKVEAPKGKAVAGIGIYQTENPDNRIALKIWTVNPDGSGGQWIKGPQGNDQPYVGPLSEIYADATPVVCPAGLVVTGVQLFRTESPDNNRLALKIQITPKTGGQGVWIPSEGNGPYFPGTGGLSDIYADKNELTLLNTNLARGVVFWPKNNRLAISVFV
jgi:hypothetical protein